MNLQGTAAEKIAWAAGLFEREGSITSKNRRPRFSLGMTDEDVVAGLAEFIREITGRDPYTYRYRRPPHKDCIAWS